MSTAKSIRDYIPLVKDQIAYQEVQSAKATSRGDDRRAQAYMSRAAAWNQMLVDMESWATASLSAPPSPTSLEASLRLSPEDIRDLPPELLDQLSISDADKRDFLVIEIIDELGGIASLDKILVAIYRKTGEIEKRSKLNARLYRMANRGVIFTYPDKKGVYTTNQAFGGAAPPDDSLVDANDPEDSNED